MTQLVCVVWVVTAQGVIWTPEVQARAPRGFVSPSHAPADDDADRFIRTGEITAGLVEWAKDRCSAPELGAYVAHHGERPAQPGWSEQ